MNKCHVVTCARPRADIWLIDGFKDTGLFVRKTFLCSEHKAIDETYYDSEEQAKEALIEGLL
jgi:hypothetical protein